MQNDMQVIVSLNIAIFNLILIVHNMNNSYSNYMMWAIIGIFSILALTGTAYTAYMLYIAYKLQQYWICFFTVLNLIGLYAHMYFFNSITSGIMIVGTLGFAIKNVTLYFKNKKQDE